MKKLVMVILLGSFQVMLYSQRGGILKGNIFDSNTNEPLSGATVILHHRNVAVIADKNGFFSIQNITSGHVLLIVSHVGYEKQEIAVNVIAGEAIHTRVA